MFGEHVTRDRERGFTMLEALVTIMLVAIVVLGVTDAVLTSMRGVDIAQNKAQMDEDLLNVIAQLRAATEYDSKRLLPKIPSSSTSTLRLPSATGQRVVTVTIASVPRSTTLYDLTLTATDADGNVATKQTTLSSEAVPPGTIKDASGYGYSPAGTFIEPAVVPSGQ